MSHLNSITNSIQTEGYRVRRRLTPQLDDNLIEFGIGRAAAEWKQAGSLSGRLGGLDSGS